MRRVHPFTVCVTLLAPAILPMAAVSSTIYVDDDAPAGGDGAGWGTAHRFLQDALATAQSGDEIRMAGGTYRPDRDDAGLAVPGSRLATFNLPSGISVFGGFRGCPGGDCIGGDPDLRDLTTFPTFLSGDLNGDDVPDLAAFLACFSGDGVFPEQGCSHYDIDADADVDQADGNLTDNCYHVVTASEAIQETRLDGVRITGGVADGPPVDDHDKGGGLLNLGGLLQLAQCHIDANVASRHGGGAYVRNGQGAAAFCSFSWNVIIERVLPAGGAGLCHEASEFTVEDCTISFNRAVEQAGGVLSFSPDAIVQRCTFEGNWSKSGAGILVEGPRTLVDDSLFRQNVALIGGAGIDVNGDMATIRNCRFEDNASQTYGAGIFDDANISTTVSGCTFVGNTAQADGGAVFMLTGMPRITHCRFHGNAADTRGGAIFLAPGDTLISNCVFSGNVSGDGGAISLFNSITNDFVIELCTFYANRAVANVGGIHSLGASQSPAISNCVFLANMDAAGTGPNSQVGGFAADIAYSCIPDDMPGDGSVAFGGAGAGNIDAVPLFVDADGPDDIAGTEDDNLTPVPGSPTIDAGNTLLVSWDLTDIDLDGDVRERVPLDLLGRPRIVDHPGSPDNGQADPPAYPNVVDMGAVEAETGGPSIPAMGAWGVVVMTLMLATVGTVMFTRSIGRRGCNLPA